MGKFVWRLHVHGFTFYWRGSHSRNIKLPETYNKKFSCRNIHELQLPLGQDKKSSADPNLGTKSKYDLFNKKNFQRKTDLLQISFRSKMVSRTTSV